MGIIIIGILLLGGLLISHSAKATSGMNDTPVTLDNIRRGVREGWYSCVLTRVDGQPAVRLSGILQDGNEYLGTYPISETDWQTLKNEGYIVV